MEYQIESLMSLIEVQGEVLAILSQRLTEDELRIIVKQTITRNMGTDPANTRKLTDFFMTAVKETKNDLFS